MSRKDKKGNKKERKGKEKLAMYDNTLANLLTGRHAIVEPEDALGSSEISIGFSSVSSATQITKYYAITKVPDYMRMRFFDEVRRVAVRTGVKINFLMYCEPHIIDWNSAEMRNKMSIWRNYTEKNNGKINPLEYRAKRSSQQATERILNSVRYLNEMELDHKRSIMRMSMVVEISVQRTEVGILNMHDAIVDFRHMCSMDDIRIKEIRVNMIDWMKRLSIFNLVKNKEVNNRMVYKIVTDDILANYNGYKQGRVGNKGICLGIDVLSSVPVMHKLKEDPDAAENWLISAETGGGKSYFVKALLTYLLADEFIVTVMDYEGDEYMNLASYIGLGNKEDVKIISMGKGSTDYFDPCAIPELTGDNDVDDDLKDEAISYILAIFRVIVAGVSGELAQLEERVISNAIKNVYDSYGVTDDKLTWMRSKAIRLRTIYDELKRIVTNKQFVDADNDNAKYKAGVKIIESCAPYFEDGETKSGTFKNPIVAERLFKSKFIIFSFGMRGAGNSLTDPTILALKQLSVACLATRISNHCKYVRKKFNVKVWEEFQRWGEVEGSAEIISNAMTGGRKRGDVNFIITNDLASIIDEDNKVSKRIRQNIQNMAIGCIRDKSVRNEFCKLFDMQDSLNALDAIATAHNIDGGINKGNGSRYRFSFCVMLAGGKKAITKVALPPALRKSSIFKTGVDVSS